MNDRGANESSKAAYITAAGAVVVALISGVFQHLKVSDLEKNSVGSLEDGQKVCSVSFENQNDPVVYSWRDSIVVPKSWDEGDCASFKGKISPGGTYQLACAYEDGIEFGSDNGSPPSKNCGW